MIVRNESDVIARALHSVKHLIDTWTIVDTGSTDNTVEIIERELSSIPGELHRRPWVDFGHNRNELLELTDPAVDYLILLDADIEVQNVSATALLSLTADAYETKVTGGIEYFLPYVIRRDFGWRYVGSTHEYLQAPPGKSPVTERLEGIEFLHHGDGGYKSDKFTRDLELLETALAHDPHDPRTLFYLAQTRQNLGDSSGAIAAYRRRIEAGGWDEEIFWSMYQIGEIYNSLGDWNIALNAYLLAWDFRPNRIEPIIKASMGLRELGAHQSAFALLERARLSADFTQEKLFVEKWMYDWGLDFEWAVNAWWVGRIAEAQQIWKRLLERDDVPSPYRTSIESNLKL